MATTEAQKRISNYALERAGAVRICVYYKNVKSKEIVRLKQTLSTYTQKFASFYKRQYGFFDAAQDMELFIIQEDIPTRPNYALNLTPSTDEEEKEVVDAIIEFVDKFYDDKEYFRLQANREKLEFTVTPLWLNEYQFLHKLYTQKPSTKATEFTEIFEDKDEAYRAAAHFVQGALREIEQKKSKLLKLLSECEHALGIGIIGKLKAHSSEEPKPATPPETPATEPKSKKKKKK